MPQLTSSERTELARSEKLLEDWERWFVKAGTALRGIRDSKLFREDHETFEEYCRVRWGWTKQRAYQLIDAVEVVESLPPKLGESVANERQARALGDVPEEHRKEVLREVAKTGDVTAEAIADAAAQKSTMVDSKTTVKSGNSEKPISKNGISEIDIPVDDKGYPIPVKILPIWRRAESELGAILADISSARSAVRKAMESTKPDEIWRQSSPNNAMIALDNAYREIKGGIPYVVCLYCQGMLPANCTVCKGTGYSGRFMVNAVPSEQIAMREKATAAALVAARKRAT